MNTNSKQAPEKPKQFKLGYLGTVNQLVKALSKIIRAMADGSLDCAKGARLCYAIGVARACMETQSLAQIEATLADLTALAEQRGMERGRNGYKPAIDSHPIRSN
jgi:hypothetical protein